MKRKTELAGANQERKSWMAKLRREIRVAMPGSTDTGVLVALKEWGKARTTRFNKAPGGLQRKGRAA